MTTYMGIDYGTKHLGLALADGPLARPLTTLDNYHPVDVFSLLGKLIGEHGVGGIVIGLPEGPMDAQVQSFGKRLEELVHIPVVYHPETLSTHEAIAGLTAAGAGAKKLKNDHVYAACLILEDYLESIN